jgi:hypothetical protein
VLGVGSMVPRRHRGVVQVMWLLLHHEVDQLMRDTPRKGGPSRAVAALYGMEFSNGRSVSAHGLALLAVEGGRHTCTTL